MLGYTAVISLWANNTNAQKITVYTTAVWKVRRLVAVRRCYAEGSGDYYAKL
jgi:hypothetical protein